MPVKEFVQRKPNPVFSAEYRALVGVLKEARRSAAMSQRMLAAQIGRSSSHIVRIEQGERRVDALELYRLARGLGIDPVQLYSRMVAEIEALEHSDRTAG